MWLERKAADNVGEISSVGVCAAQSDGGMMTESRWGLVQGVGLVAIAAAAQGT